MLPSVIKTQREIALRRFLLNSFEMSSPLFRGCFGITLLDGFSAEKRHLSKCSNEQQIKVCYG